MSLTASRLLEEALIGAGIALCGILLMVMLLGAMLDAKHALRGLFRRRRPK